MQKEAKLKRNTVCFFFFCTEIRYLQVLEEVKIVDLHKSAQNEEET